MSSIRDRGLVDGPPQQVDQPALQQVVDAVAARDPPRSAARQRHPPDRALDDVVLDDAVLVRVSGTHG